MMLNPLFIPVARSGSSNLSAVQPKINKPTYLFSDIIRLLSDSTPGKNIVNPGENNTVIENPATSLLPGNILQGNTGACDSVNFTVSGKELEAFLKNLLAKISENGVDLNNIQESSSPGETAGNSGKGKKLSNSIIKLLKDNNSLAVNSNLLNGAALNFNDKQQLVTKIFGSDAELKLEPDSINSEEIDNLNKELEEIASALFQLLSPQKKDNNKLEELSTGQGIDNDSKVQETISSILSSERPVVLNFNVGESKIKIEVSPEQLIKTGDSSKTPLSSDQPIVLNPGAGEDKIKIEASPDQLTKTGDPLKTPEISAEETKAIVNILKNNKNITGSTGDSSITSGDLNTEPNFSGVPKNNANINFNLKITTEKINELDQSTGKLKEMLANMGISDKVETQVISKENKTVDTFVSGKTTLKDTQKSDVTEKLSAETGRINPEIEDNQVLGNDKKGHSEDTSSAEINEKPVIVNQKNPEVKKDFKTSETLNSKTSVEAESSQAVISKSETPGKKAGQDLSQDKKNQESFRLILNQDNTTGTRVAKNETFENTLRLPVEDNKIVKAENLIKEMSHIFEQGESKSIVLKLNPDTLGKVKITLDVVDKAVHANIQVENESVRQVVQNNINVLKQTLDLSGLQLSSFNVSLNYSAEKDSGKFHGQKKKFSSMSSSFNHGVPGESDLIITKSMGYNTYDYLV